MPLLLGSSSCAPLDCDQEPARGRVLVMTEEVIKEVITSVPAPAALSSEDQLMNSPDTIDGNSVPPDHKRKEKPVPHYMRSSTRSCHDNCKYGTHHSPESKKHWPVIRRQLRRASTGNQEIDKVEIMVPQRGRPRNDQKLENSHVKSGSATAPSKPARNSSEAPPEIVPDNSQISTSCVEDLPAQESEPGNLPTDAECFVISHDDVADFGDGESSDGAESIELEMPLAIQDSDSSDENMEDGILPSENACKDRASSGMRNTLTVMTTVKHEQAGARTKLKISADAPIKPKEKVALSVTRNTASTPKSRRTSHPKAAVADLEISSEPKTMRTRADASVTATTTKFSRQKKISPTVKSAVPKFKEIKAPLPSNATDPSAKPARLAKLKVSVAKNAPSPSLSSENQTDKKMAVRNVARNAQVIQKQQEEKVVTPRSLKLARSINMPAKSISSVTVRAVKKERIAPPIKNSKKVSGTEISTADPKDSKKKSLKPSSLKDRKPEVNGKESQPRKEKPDTPTPRTRTPRASKSATIPSNMATQPPRKLTFRRGKVLNPDEGSSSTPTRRLRFRPVMTAADATVRSRGSRINGKGIGHGAAGARVASTSRAEVVVLRRQGGDRKRQEQVLLNNVIEETASRLVAEARKSKVKALVGAFETVISLQEGGKTGPPATAATTTAVAQ